MSCAHSFGEWCPGCIDGMVQAYNRVRKENAALLAHRAVLREALQHFFDVWPEVEKGINSAFVMAHIHGGNYTGPQLPIDEMRAALSSGEGRTQEEEKI